MFKLTLTPKQFTKIETKIINNLKPIPKNWEEFVKLTKIRSGGDIVQFIPFEYQKILIELMRQYSNLIIIKSRQLGCSQVIASKFLYDTALNPASSSVAFMRNQDDVGSLSRRIKQMLGCLEEYILPESDQVGYLKLKGLGDFYIKNSSKEGIRSIDSVTNMLFDEAAFIQNIESIYAASSPSAALVGDKLTKVIVSTPSAKMGWYWNKLSDNNGTRDIEELCKQVASGNLYKEIPGMYWFEDESGACKVILHWRLIPAYKKIDDEYPGGYLAYRQKQDGTDEETVAREYDLQFIDSSVAVFTADLVSSCINESSLPNSPNPLANYYLGLDTSTIGSDFLTCPVVEDLNGKLRLVDYYRRRREQSGVHLYHIGELIKKWKPQAVGIEITGGVGTLYLEKLAEQFKEVRIEAIRTTQDSKPTMVSRLSLAMEKKVLSFAKDQVLIDELLSFMRNGRSLEASPGKTDDLVMGLCFAIAVTPFGQPDLEKPYFSDFPTIRRFS